MRHLATHRTFALTSSMLAVALLAPAAVLAAGPRDGSCDPIGTGPNGPAATAPGRMAGAGGSAAGMGRSQRGDRTPGRQANRGAEQMAARRGTGQGIRQPVSGVLTEAQKLDLAAMAEEEKLAHDLYATFGAAFDGAELSRIAASESSTIQSTSRSSSRSLSFPANGAIALLSP